MNGLIPPSPVNRKHNRLSPCSKSNMKIEKGTALAFSDDPIGQIYEEAICSELEFIAFFCFQSVLPGSDQLVG